MTEVFCVCRKFTDRKFIVDILAILFGISAWIFVNGMYVQLPLMVQILPENWNLPSYLAVIIQIANIGPILYSLSQKFIPGVIKDSWIIYVLLTCGTIAGLLMAFFYQRTTVIGEEEHSTALFILTFFGALVGCTSSVLFMPFMGNFREIYLISYFVGEGLSGFLPSIVALIQGVGGNPTCIPNPDNSSQFIPYTEPPEFSSQDFYFFLFAMLALSTIAFFLLNNLTVCKGERTDTKSQSRSVSHNIVDGQDPGIPTHNSIFTVKEDVQALMKDSEAKPTQGVHAESRSAVKTGENEAVKVPSYSAGLSQNMYLYLLVLAAWVCMFGNGILPSVQSFSCLPYGNVAYHLAVTLGSMANPMICFFAFFYPYTSVRIISVLTSLSTIFIGYILATALLSPTPPIVNTSAGDALVVISWVIIHGLITYIKVSIASIFRKEGGRSLFWCGAVQQMGSAVGALLAFSLINFTELFTSYQPCV